MILITKDIEERVPRLYSQENNPDPTVHAKFFAPWTNWTWYLIEYDGKDLCFGLVDGFEVELGYFSILELTSIVGPGMLKIERDMYFNPKPLSEVKEMVERSRAFRET